jgi:hypothetical protein
MPLDFGSGDELAPDMDWTAGIVPGTTQNLDPGLAGGPGIAQGTGTGQHGVAAMNGNGGGLGGLWDWFHQPFQTPLNTADIILLVGIVVIALWLWGLVLYHVRIAAETI